MRLEAGSAFPPSRGPDCTGPAKARRVQGSSALADREAVEWAADILPGARPLRWADRRGWASALVRAGCAAFVLGVTLAFAQDANASQTRLHAVSVDASAGEAGGYATAAVDGRLSTSWKTCGSRQWIVFDLGRSEVVRSLRIAFAGARTEHYRFNVQAGVGGGRSRWWTVARRESTHQKGFQTFALRHGQTTRYVRIVALGSSGPLPSCENRYAEIRLRGYPHYRADLETGNGHQFTELECADADRQFRVVESPVRQGSYAARFEERPGDLWAGNGTVRCLGVNGQTNEHAGDDLYYTMSFYFPRPITQNLLWETHTRSDIYSISDPLSVVPNAIVAQSPSGTYDDLANRLSYRLESGAGVFDGTSWTGWSYTEPDLPIVSPIPTKTWIDIIVHVRFREDATGEVEVWERSGRRPWPNRPQVRRVNVPTMQYVPGGLDPRIPQTIHTSSLYDAVGLYKGGPAASRSDVVYVDAVEAASTLLAARRTLSVRGPTATR